MSRMGDAYIEIQDLTNEALESGAKTVNDVLVYVNTYSTLKVDEETIVHIIQTLDWEQDGM